MTFKVAMIGVGKLGMPCAEVFAEHYDVIGYDIQAKPDVKIKIAATLTEAVKNRDLIFVAVDTPHDHNYGGAAPASDLPPRDFDYTHVKSALSEINKVTNRQQLVVLISTVLPGTSRKELVPLIPNAGFIYNPYLIAMGSVKWDLVNPEMIIIGTGDGSLTGDAMILKQFYAPIVQNPRYAIGTWDEAECIKIFYNTFISMKIGVVNMIMDVAMANGNINVDVVTDALKGAGQRIVSTRYMTAGMGDGGPCHPRDNIALRFLADRLGLGYDLFQAIIESRERQALNIAKALVAAATEHNLPIVINGKAYKPGVPFIDGSYSLLISHFVRHLGHDVIWVDPQTGDIPTINGPAVFLLAHNAIVAYPEASGMSVDSQPYCAILPGSIVIDPWRLFPGMPGVTVVHYGNSRHFGANKPSDWERYNDKEAAS
jgi:UDPglucose 6-dehydrogenase